MADGLNIKERARLIFMDALGTVDASVAVRRSKFGNCIADDVYA
jgi:hypothetical protein